jgi:hypothetical protein
MFGHRYPHRKKASDSTRNALLPKGHAFPKLVRAHFAKFAPGTYFLLLILPLLHLSRLWSTLITPWRVCTSAFPWRDWGVSECDLVHEPILGIIFKRRDVVTQVVQALWSRAWKWDVCLAIWVSVDPV